MTYEDNFLKRIDDSFKPKSLLEDDDLRSKFLKKKRELVDTYRPNLNDFKGIKNEKGELLYSTEEIDNDIEEEIRLEKIFEEKNFESSDRMKALYEVSQLYEGAVIDQAEANAWFGECEIIPASKFDDFKNGIDGIGVFKDKDDLREKYFGFGIDVTFASNNEVLLSKLDSIKAVIRRNVADPDKNPLPQAKYVVDEEGNYTSLFVAKVIVGSRYSSAEKLVKLWGSEKKGRNKELQNHPVQSKMIMETLWQALYFHKYAVRIKNEEAAYSYGKLYNNFVEIFEGKKELIENHWDEIQDDVVFETVRKYTGND